MVGTTVDNKTADVRTRIEPELKEAAVKVLAQNGLTLSDAMRLFLRQVVLYKGLPFEVRQPNEATVRALRESRAMREKARFGSVAELIDELEKEGRK
ncbi:MULTISPECIES: type II toxin-antitoxin system RelB/DinJ family antitoxin [Paraburkholderia]|jgi:DNA-damage-inducible protein J|uniref:DNA-damage-inducible protein J n=1 Tax=Paraburkholderia phenazinium TaxID=60549 RepID=A0A1N6JBQ9_9BURK|nr:type II toxin-antitoxin system RelB/DinJ family antitoxin [Paraburkholderia phenazinium]SIO41651.1 DNA-damage-inducible protein J [Paraburkholderia phenazinium]SIO50127.1 DNA-damage-inducible protein J [Paraburkholderia phenazinium]